MSDSDRKQPTDASEDSATEDSEAIVSRRKMLIASALAVAGSAVAASACPCLSSRPCLSVTAPRPDASTPPPPPPPPAKKKPPKAGTAKSKPVKRPGPARMPASRICLSFPNPNR